MWNPRRFTRHLITYSFLVMAVEAVLRMLLRTDTSSLALTFAPVVVAAMQEGQKHAAATGVYPETTQIWRISRGMAEVCLTLWFLLTLALGLVVTNVRVMLMYIDLILLFSIFGVFTLMALIAIRWSYAWGVRLELRQHNNHMG